jgi:hypothetical protein
MNRAEYARYVLRRLAEALAISLGAGLIALALQRGGWLTPVHLAALPVLAGAGPRAEAAIARASWWAWPACWALLGHLVLGPKQRRPVYLRVPGAMYAYAGVKVDRNAGCRGGCVTGATGSGKTLSCIVPRLHSLCVNEAGVERPEWRGSRASRDLNALRESLRGQRRDDLREIGRLGALQEASDACRAARYLVPPWGGFICGEKGNEWQMMEPLLRRHGREEDLRILRTRPAGAPRDWTPHVRFNLLSMDEIPADTYAKLIVDTGLSVEEAPSRDEFFVPQARDKIAWGIRLVRSVRAAGAAPPPAGPSLLILLDILTVQESYRRYLLRCTSENPLLAESGEFGEARFQLENNYWNQPADQLGGVRSTLYNFLVPFAEPEIAEVFCADSTFDLRSIGKGCVACLAVPQKFALQRRYVATLMKTLAYQIILQRFDARRDHPDWLERNVILVEQDEWQRHAVRADCEADVVREAQGAVYAATQSQNAVWAKLGGRQNAAPLLANLRNRWICQAATGECAEESSQVAGGRLCRELSYSTGSSSSTTNVSFAERPFLPARELRALPPFHVVFVPAEGPWLYRKCIAMPATPEGGIPPWWFGDWNPLHWAARLLGLPEKLGCVTLHPGSSLVPPWRASAPLRAQIRWLAGLDGTFIVTGQMRTRDAARASVRPGK